MDCRPEPQNRFTVIPDVVIGRPAQIHPLLAFRKGTADDHVIDILPFELVYS
jgi:hypothetical protein